MKELLVNSFGGCGSKLLAKQIIHSLDLPLPYGQYHKHERNPELIELDDIQRKVYVYGDPLQAILSFFVRQKVNTHLHGFNPTVQDGRLDWVNRHCRNLKGNVEGMRYEMSLVDFIENGDDFFKLEDFFNRWIKHAHTSPILFVRYETIWDNLKGIAEQLELPASFINNFPAKEPRSADINVLSELQQDKLKDMLSNLISNINELPDLFLLGHKSIKPDVYAV